jgi:uncharacterized membrane protein YfcA
LDFIADPWFYAAAIPAVLLTGISKGGLGLAGGLSVPILSLVTSPVQAAAVMLPILVVMDLSAVWAYRGHWDRTNMRLLLPAGLLGIVVGWLVFRLLNDDAIRVLIGLIAVGFVLSSLRKSARTARPTRASGYFWGGTAGFTSFVAHAGSPPLAVYLLPQRLEPVLHVGTSVVFFAVINLAKLPPYFELGLLDARNMSTALLLIPLGAFGIAVGVWLRTRMNPTLFFRASYVLLLGTGAKLLYDGVRNLAGI